MACKTTQLLEVQGCVVPCLKALISGCSFHDSQKHGSTFEVSHALLKSTILVRSPLVGCELFLACLYVRVHVDNEYVTK